jgi:hypothetical protein
MTTEEVANDGYQVKSLPPYLKTPCHAVENL